MQIYLLGPFRACVDGTFIRHWPSGKSRKVFQYLVSRHDDAVAKERLMALFWPDSEPDAARNSLNVAIYGIRKSLRQADPEFSYVLYRETSYCINPAVDLWLDTEEFLRGYRRFEACRRRNDPAMFDLAQRAIVVLEDGLPSGRIREDWASPMQRDVREKYCAMIRHLADYSFEQGRVDEAIDFCNKIISVDPYDEEIHRRLMTSYYRTGRTHLALRQYSRCFDALTKDLKIVPAAETTQLFQQIRQRARAGAHTAQALCPSPRSVD